MTVPPKQAPGYYRRRVGDLVVTALNDGHLDIPVDKLLNIGPEEAEARLLAATRRPGPRCSVNAYLVQGGGRTILVDTGSGDTMGPTMGRLPGALAAAGVPPGEIDLVLMTHMHGDHFGGLSTPGGTAVFPQAELGLAEAEAAFWLTETALSGAAEARKPYVKGAQAAAAAYRGRLTTADAPAPGITRVMLPGHTPGHCGYRVDSGTESLLIWGDVMHVPELQAADPGICLVYDLDPAAAEASRRRALDMVVADDMLIAGMHLPFPGLQHAARAGTGYRLIPEPWLADV